MKSQQRNLKKKTNGVKNARPVHVSETWEQIVILGSSKTTRGQISCYCPRKMLLPRKQITRRILCFYYTCKFGVISIRYVIRCSKHSNIILRSWG